MAAGIQGRVREHGNPGELDPVQNGPGSVPSAAPASGHSLLVDVKLHPVQSGILFRMDGVIGTDQSTHGAPDAGMGHIGFLPDSVKHVLLCDLLRLSLDTGFQGPFSEHCQFDGLYRTHGSALAAQGAAVIAVFHLPGQVVET
jgi:hypothetical protein